MIHVPGRWDSVRFYHTIQNSGHFKTYELFISKIFHLVFSNYGWSWQVTEPMESETMDEGMRGTYWLLVVCIGKNCL